MDLKPLFESIELLQAKVDKIFIYGFGSYGRNLYKILKKHNMVVDGFVVTKKSSELDTHELPVYSAEQILSDNVGFILALNYKNAEEVKHYLKENGIEETRVIHAGMYLEQFGEKRGMKVGSIEVTTIMGCKVNCKHCPQGLLLSRYFQNNPDRTRVMSIDTFEKCIEYFPKEYDLSFGGMSEPFLNDNFIEMLRIAVQRGKRISLYTTLVGIKKEQVEEILSLPIDFVVVHVADKLGYAHIEKSEDYYYILEQFLNAKKKDGKPFVNMCNAQAEPDERVAQICNGKYEIFTEMTDRAGNLDNVDLIHNRQIEGKISCGNLGVDMNNNILLPDGSVVLCCMDYGLRHMLGNIYRDTYEQLMNGEEMTRVKTGMDGDMSIDILCRNCSYARERA